MDVEGDEIPFVWFFLPLPTPLRVPHAWTFRSFRAPSFDDIDNYGAVAGLNASICFHQVETAQSPLTLVSEITGFAKATIEGADTVGAEFPTFSHSTSLTLAEVAIPLPLDGVDVEVLSEAFDRAVDVVRDVQRAHSLAVGTFDDLVTMEALPPFVPMASGVAGGESPPERNLSMFIVNSSFARATADPAMGEDDLHRLVHVIQEFGDGHPFEGYTDLRRELQVQENLKGDTRSIALTAGVAGEVFLDSTLLYLLWEEAFAPSEAARLMSFPESTHIDRVRAQFHPRLGGSWDVGGNGKVAKYWRSTVLLRHRVVHAGYSPTREEVRAATAALYEMERYLGDRLAYSAKRGRYVRTAWAFCGDEGLARRGAFTKRVRQMTEDPNQPYWIAAFARWKRYIDRELDPDPPIPGEDPDRVEAYLLFDGQTRTETLVLHDDLALSASYSAQYQDSLPAETFERAREAAEEWFSHPDVPDPFILRLWRVESLPGDLDWRSAYELLPNMGISPQAA